MSEDKTTAAACIRQTCEGCEIEGQLMCIHTKEDLLDFLIPFVSYAIPYFAGMIIGQFWWGLAIWFVLAVAFFAYVEALVLCRHCPHYAEEGFTLRCHANWGLPKIPGFDPRPLNDLEKIAWTVYAVLLFTWYVPFFIASGQWLLLALTTWGGFAAGWLLLRTKCTRCYNLSCPVNRVPEEVRQIFFKNYPEFAEAWERTE